MNARTPINDELKSIAPALLQAPATMPYTLPPDYFLHFAPNMVRVVSNDQELPATLSVISRSTPYHIPANYFEGFPQSVLQKIKADHLLGAEPELELLGQLSKAMYYTVPEGYFESLPEILLQKVSEEQQHTVPPGYFEHFPELMLAKVRQMEAKDELDDVAPLLLTIDRKPVQHVPQGYFQNLQPVLPALQKPATVISIGKKRSWYKYAAAASVALLLSFSAYFVFNGSKKAVPSIANQPSINAINNELASLDVSAIESYLGPNATTQTPSVSADDLEELNNSDLDELLQDFTDQQLKKHIDEAPELPGASNSKNHS